MTYNQAKIDAYELLEKAVIALRAAYQQEDDEPDVPSSDFLRSRVSSRGASSGMPNDSISKAMFHGFNNSHSKKLAQPKIKQETRRTGG